MQLQDQSVCVLCVDDDLAIRNFVSVQLSKAGYDVVVAVDGKRAHEIVAMGRPDIILVDVDVALVDGCQFSTFIKQDPTLRDLPIIALSGAHQAQSRDRLIGDGVDDFLNKPIDKAELIATVRSHVRMYRLYRSLHDTNEELQSAYNAACDAQARYRSLIDEALDAMFVVDAESGLVREGNIAAATLVGVSQADLFGKLFKDLCPACARVFAPATLETEFFGASAVIPVTVKLSRVRSLSGDLVQYVVRDLTPVHETVAARIEAERTAAIVETGVTVNERLNTPLTVIINNAETLRTSQRGASSKVVTRLDYILQAARQMREVVELLTRVKRSSSTEYLPGTTMLDLEAAVADIEKGQATS